MYKDNVIATKQAFLEIRCKALTDALIGLLDGLDANTDERCGLSDIQWEQRIKVARGLLNDEDKP